MKVVIVGGVAGGASAAARIRRLDEHAQIIMIERSGYVSKLVTHDKKPRNRFGFEVFLFPYSQIAINRRSGSSTRRLQGRLFHSSIVTQ